VCLRWLNLSFRILNIYRSIKINIMEFVIRLSCWRRQFSFVITSGGLTQQHANKSFHEKQNFEELELRSMERGICPIATLALRLTLYSLTASRVWPIGSLDVISHVTIVTADGPFLLVIHWHHVPISHRCRDIKRHNLDNHIPIVNTLETNFGDLRGWIGDDAFFSNLSLAAAKRRSVNY